MLKTAVMSSKGQVVIPAALRKRFKMKEGTTIVFQEDKGRIVLEPKNWEGLLALKGSFDYDLEGSLIEERALETKREEERAEEYERDVEQ
jgi:AbrB family looped-hinge helix DNA binding protein